MNTIIKYLKYFKVAIALCFIVSFTLTNQDLEYETFINQELLEKEYHITARDRELIESEAEVLYAYIPDNILTIFKELASENFIQESHVIPYAQALDITYKALQSIDTSITLTIPETKESLTQYLKELEDGDALITTERENITKKHSKKKCPIVCNLLIKNFLKTRNITVCGNEHVQGQLTVAGHTQATTLNTSDTTLLNNVLIIKAVPTRASFLPRVGIGTLNPQEALDIQGNVRVSGTVFAQNISSSSSSTKLTVEGDITSTHGNITAPQGIISGSALSSSTLTVSGNTQLNSVTAQSLNSSGPLNAQSANLGDTTVSSLTNTGPLNVSGLSTLNTVIAQSLTSQGPLSVLGNTTLNTVNVNSLSSNGPLNVSGTFNAQTANLGDTTVSSLTDTGFLNVSGPSTLNTVISQSLASEGPLSVTGLTTLNNTIINQNLNVGADTLAVNSITGRVGIGVSSPTEALDVSGNAKFSGSLTAGTLNVTSIVAPNLTVPGDITSTGGNILAPSGTISGSALASSNTLDVSGDSNLTNVNLNSLQVNNALNVSGVATLDSATVINAITADNPTFVVDSLNHRVGIGTTTPAYKLDIAGDTNITGSLIANTANLGTTSVTNLVNSGNLTVSGSTTLQQLTNGIIRSSAGLLSNTLVDTADIVDNAITADKIAPGSITNTHIANTANISDIKLATIATAGKVANTATSATSSSNPDTLVLRDTNSNFSANIITATQFDGPATTAGSFSGNLAGDVTGTQSATVVSFVGGQTAANIAAGAALANASTSNNTPNTIVRRNASGGFSAGTITATLSGNATSATSATTANSVVGQTSANTPGRVVQRDGAGNFAAGTITASLNGNATTATTAVNFSGSLSGDITGTQSATVIAPNAVTNSKIAPNAVQESQIADNAVTTNKIADTAVTGSKIANQTITNANIANQTITATQIANDTITNANISSIAAISDTKLDTISTAGKVANSATTATSINNTGTIVARDENGNFSAGVITANILGDVTGNASLSSLTAGDTTINGSLNLTGPGNITVGGTGIFNNGVTFNAGVPGLPQNVLLVTTGPLSGPNEYNSIKAAVDSIGTTRPASSATNPYVVQIGAGVYIEDTITLPRYVALVGESPFSCVIEVDDPSKTIIKGAQNSSVEHCLLRGATDSGSAAIEHTDSGVFRVFHCRFGKNDILVRQIATSPSTALTMQASGADADSNFTTGFYLRGSNSERLAAVVNDFVWQPTTVQSQLANFVDISGENTVFLGSTITIGSPSTISIGGTAFQVQNGSTLRLNGAAVIGFNQGIYVPNTLIGPVLQIVGIYCKLNTKDLVIDNALTTGSIVGTISHSSDKITIAPSTSLSLLLNDPEDPGVTTVGPLFAGETVDQITNITPQIEQGANLGVISEGTLSSTGLDISTATGTGYLMVNNAPDDNLKYMAWNATGTTVPTGTNNYIYIDNTGALKIDAAEPDVIKNILLGRVQTDSSSVLYLQQIQKQATHTANLLDEAWRKALGVIYASGSTVASLGTNQLTVGSGTYYFGTKKYTPSGGSPINWIAFYRSGVPGQYNTIASNNTLDNLYDDNSGTLTPIPAGKVARHSLYIVGDGADERYLFVYAQTVYDNTAQAEAGVIPTPPTTFGDNIALIASIIVTDTGTIDTILQEQPKISSKATSTSGVTNHGDLTGLLADDHPQYVLTNGGRVMTGDLNLGGNNIVNVNLVKNVDIAAHAARHLPNGADPLTIGQPVTISTTNATGAANSFALSDHQHAHGDLPGGSLHALATTGTAGFMSAADKQIVDSINPANFVLKAGDTMTGTLTITPSTGNALIANGTASSAVIQVTPESTSKGITISSTSDNALEVNTNKFTVQGDTGNTTIDGTLNVNGTTTLALGAGVVHADNTGVLSSSALTNSDIAANAAISYSKLNLTNAIVNSDISPSANIADTKLATISTVGKVANSATTATAANTTDTIVLRNGGGNFSAGTITANLTGNVTGNLTGSASNNVLKVGDTMSGTLTIDTTLSATGTTALSIIPQTASKGITIGSTTDNALEINTNKFTVQGNNGNTFVGGNLGVMNTTTLLNLAYGGTDNRVVHATNSGVLLASLITNSDIGSNTITDDKLQTISTPGKVANSATTATSFNVTGTIVARDNNGDFSAGTITANLVGNASSSTNFSGSLSGDVTGTQTATVVSSVGGQSAASIASGATLANNATSANTPNTLVKRDGSGNFSAGTVTANLTGNASGNVLKTGDTMTGSLTINPSAATALTTTGNVSISGATTGNALLVSGNATASSPIAQIAASNGQIGLQVTGNGSAAGIQVSGNTGSGTGIIINRSTAASGGVGLAITGSSFATAETINAGTNQVGLSITTGSGTSKGIEVVATTSTSNGLTVTGNTSAPAVTLTAGTGRPALAVSDGTVAAPSIAFINEQNSGVYRIGANSVGISTNGTNRLIADTNGVRYTSNYKVQAYANANRTLTAATETVRYNTVSFDPGNNFNTSTFTYTAPVTGYYFVSAQLCTIPASNNTPGLLQLVKNGSAQTGYSSSANLIRAGNRNNMLYITTLITLNQGDTLRIDYSGSVSDIIQANDTSIAIHLFSI